MNQGLERIRAWDLKHKQKKLALDMHVDILSIVMSSKAEKMCTYSDGWCGGNL